MEENKFIIHGIQYDMMIDHCSSYLPYEACGILAGRNNEVDSIWKLENELKSDRRFFISKNKIEETVREISKQEKDILAIYHSHPSTTPVPSYLDIVNHPDPSVKLVIVSYKLNVLKVKCYDISNGLYKERPFLISPTH
ncbi:M67 family metallopeptidase [Peribacillus frigoritolerans]|uniref:M67 family metallopeptidase n=1 Tax=Peribacillus frigoritolerans TaxID=450367 RepID=UPI003D28A400